MSASSPSKASATNSSPDPCRHDTPPPPLSASLPPSRHSASVFAPVPAAVPTHYTFVSVSVPAPTGYSTAASGTPHICLHIRLCPCLYRLRYSPPPSFLCPPALRIRIRLCPFSPAPCTPPPSLPPTQPPFPSVSAALPAASTASLHPHHVTALPYHSLYLHSPSPPLHLFTSAPFCRHPSRPCPCCHPCHHLRPFRLRLPPNQQPDCPSPECTHSQPAPQQIPTACPTQSRNHPPADSIFLFRALHDRLPQQKTPFHSRKNHIPRKR